jgi:hypothetical protein
MKKFRFWAIFGIIINAIYLLRGLVSPFVDASGWELWAWIALGLLLIAVAIPGIVSSVWILQKKKAGFAIAHRQVWFFALTDVLSSFLFLLVEPGRSTRNEIIGAFIGLALASQLSRLFNSEEAMAYCKEQ